MTAEARDRADIAPDLPAAAPAPHGEAERARWTRPALAVLAVVAVVARLVSTGELWLDEAQTVAISRLPTGDLFEGLRQDGSPPLFYLLLKLWMAVLGDSTTSVRLLSGLLGIAALPAMWALGRRLAGTTAAWIGVALLASSPFAVRYSTEARMYALVVLLVLLGGLALARASDQRTPGRLAAVALLTAALLYTHYWALYLVASVVVILWWRSRSRRTERPLLAATLVGAALFVPWVPTLLHQLGRTGTPWSTRPDFAALISALSDYAGGETSAGRALGILLLALAGLGLFGVPLDRDRVELDWRTQPPGRLLAAVVGGTVGLALLAGILSGSAITSRYTAVVLAPFLLLVARGAGVMDPRRRRGVVAVAVLLGLVGAWDHVGDARTQVPEVVATLERRAEPGDVVVFCPDQLGPSTARLLDDDIAQVVYPTLTEPERVDWTDYLERYRDADARTLARAVDALPEPGGSVWLVTSPIYRTVNDACGDLRDELSELRPRVRDLVRPNGNFDEEAALARFADR